MYYKRIFRKLKKKLIRLIDYILELRYRMEQAKRDKNRIPCVVDYKKRYKIIFGFTDMKAVCVDCEICGMTYWARNLTELKVTIRDFSNCSGPRIDP